MNFKAVLSIGKVGTRGAEPPGGVVERRVSVEFETAPWGAGPRNPLASERQDSVRFQLCLVCAHERSRDLCPPAPCGLFRVRVFVDGRYWFGVSF